MTVLEKIDHKVSQIHKKYDELHGEAKKKEQKLKELIVTLSDLKRECELVDSHNKLQDSPQAKV